MMGFLRGLDCGKNGETTVMIGNSGNKKAGAPFPARLIAVSLPPEKALISKNPTAQRESSKRTSSSGGNAGSSGPCAIANIITGR
ncbi:CvaB, IS186 transposase [Escherichia coli]|nr:CvaB, IS186 transposase [Escherichia coli]